MGLDFKFDKDDTVLDEDEKEGLLIPSITTQSELDEFEQLNIQKAQYWVLNQKGNPDILLTETFINKLHKQMLDEVWKWAGTFRKTNKNLGVDKLQISVELKQLLEDCKYWIENQTYPNDEIAIRFKHRLVSIHCYANGNGRHSRLMADVLVSNVLGEPVFSWGGGTNLIAKSNTRENYIIALKAADRGSLDLLIEFARG